MVGVLMQISSALLAVAAFVMGLQQEEALSPYIFDWLNVGHYTVALGIQQDFPALLMLMVTAIISSLVQVFSSSYMKNDPSYRRFFAFLGLFTFAMYGVVLCTDLLLIYVSWELVGFCSYMLIGFWREKNKAVRAAKKAFVVNRIGDVGFVIALMCLFGLFGTTNLQLLSGQVLTVLANPENVWWVGLAGVGLMLAAMAKSAQWPFSVWLPDAMEGPTPVSALIHAATMVAAGIYLLARVFFLLLPEVQEVLAFIGLMTAFFAAYAALGQNDIKKVLAYSTISQLGYMVIGIGVGAIDAAFFHLVTHAFFKAGLFLGAAAIIHKLHKLHDHSDTHFDAQDIRIMGGLRHRMPVTFWSFMVSAAALAGIPLFSGFLSKDMILSASWHYAMAEGGVTYLLPVIGLLTALMTAFYTGRLFFRIFMVKPSELIQQHGEVITDPGKRMRYPLVILAVASLGIVFSLNPIHGVHGWLHHNLSFDAFDWSLVGVEIEVLSIFLTAIGLGLAWWLYLRKDAFGQLVRKPSVLRSLSTHFFYFNELYAGSVNTITKMAALLNSVPSADGIIVRTTLWSSVVVRRFDNGVVDALVRVVGVINVLLAHLLAFFDRYFVDGVVKGLVYLTGFSGKVTKSVQDGKVQVYIVWSILLLIGLLWIIL
ncbi:NADH-quinone oxidoreductase subunit L [Algivirga pacifica]|uniref:NADH-quinone oxidoreductase subunit L n=2 Tax=Algivirga pacifica TaxID=1162670 RepID=A0ABP9DB11_9BACT